MVLFLQMPMILSADLIFSGFVSCDQFLQRAYFYQKIGKKGWHFLIFCLSRTCRSLQVDHPGPSYHYYQTNQVRTHLTSTSIQKYYNIHSWLDNVVKNTNSEPVADFESDSHIEEESDSLLVGDDYTCSANLDQRYPPRIACAKAKSRITDQKETLSRQEKIKTLKALITKHEKSTRKERLKRQKLEPMRNMYCGLKALRKQDPGLSHGNNDINQNKYAGNYSNEQNIAGLGISTRE